MAIFASPNYFNRLRANNLPRFRPAAFLPDTLIKVISGEIGKILADNGVSVNFVEATPGYSYTQFWYRLAHPNSMPLCMMRKYLDDLRRVSPREAPVRFVYHPTEDDVFGFEVVNGARAPVDYNQAVFTDVPGELCFAVGAELAHHYLYDDLAEAGHLLVAGGERSGKTSFLQNLVLQLSMRYHPHHVRFILADCDEHSYDYYSSFPHSLTANQLSDINDILASLKMLNDEVTERMQILRNGGYVNVAQYNRINKQSQQNVLPHLVFIMDEVMPIMQMSGKIFCELLLPILACGAQAGVHVVLSTGGNVLQILPRSVLAGFSTCAQFKTEYPDESMFLLGDEDGTLLRGEGDMLYRKGKMRPVRVLDLYLYDSYRDIYRNNILMSFSAPIYENVRNAIYNSERLEKDFDWKFKNVDTSKMDRLCRKAVNIWLGTGKVTVASLLISLHIPYKRACDIVQQMLNVGVICYQADSDDMQMVATQKDVDRLFFNFSM